MKKKYDWLSFFDLWGLQSGTNESRVGNQKIEKKIFTGQIKKLKKMWSCWQHNDFNQGGKGVPGY
jgi:hypothetical protein